MTAATYGSDVSWQPDELRLRPLRLLLNWAILTIAVYVAALVVPGVDLYRFGSAIAVAAAVAVLNAVLPPVIAAFPLPYMLLIGFVGITFLDAALLLVAEDLLPERVAIGSFGDAFLASLVIAATSMVLQIAAGINDDDQYSLRVSRRVARRLGRVRHTDVPGIIFLEIDGLARPVLRDAIRDGNAPNMARWLADDGYVLTEWETDLSSQTGASQAGILLGSNQDIPAFRWVEKESGRMMACSAPADCAELERRHATGQGLLIGGGASRGNLLSGEADEAILTVSRIEAERRANPGYRAFLANGFNVTRVLVLYGWEVILEWLAAARQRRRDVHPRGHRGGIYPFLRGAMCVFVRDLVIYGVLSDMMRGCPAVYATFASYDEVAHHSGLQRADTMEALRKLDEAFGRLERARPFAPRPYEIVVLSDHGQTQGATFKQRNGYGLDDLVRRSLTDADVAVFEGGDEQDAVVGHAVNEATGRKADPEEASGGAVPDRGAIVLGSGNLGLVYLMDERRRLTLEEIEERHPRLITALRSHPHVGWLLVRSARDGAMVLGPAGTRFLDQDRVEGDDPLAHFSPTAAQHLRRTDGFSNVADIMVGSFYDPVLQDGCAFEELISFHGGLGGPQTQPFVLHPAHLAVPDEPLLGAAAIHALLCGWREELQGAPVAAAEAA